MVKYHQQYCQTLEIYRHYFGTPPSDIWNMPRVKTKGSSFQLVDLNQLNG
ncbi:hypothetical protein RintRC_6040 [Richelia intracellularis]|nr:hypothetical protein RintRC_6040 [Richelia intracellularis]